MQKNNDVRPYIFVVFVSISALYASAGSLAENSMSICGTNFFAEFEDSSLSTTQMKRIFEDIASMRQSWTNSIIHFEMSDGFDGYIDDGGIDFSAYAFGTFEMPTHFRCIGSTNFIWMPRDLSSAYTNAFALIDENVNAYVSAIAFASNMLTGAFVNTPSNEVHRLIYDPNMPREAYACNRDRVIKELSEQRYVMPSALSFHQTGPGTNGFSQSVIWMKIPAFTHPSYSATDVLDFFDAVWYEGMWRMYPSEW